MKKRVLSILLASLMVVMLLPITAFAGAEITYPVWIAGIQVTEDNMTDVLGTADGDSKTVTFNPQTNTLTLNGASVAFTGTATGFGYGNNACGVKSELETLNVNLVGKNQIGKEINSESALEDYSIDMGFSNTGDIVFTGNADSETIIYDYCAGIKAKNVTFSEEFKGKLTVRDSGGAEPQPPCAINAVGVFNSDTLDYISDGNVNILGGTFDLTSFESNGISAAGSININNANVTVVAGSSAFENVFGNITVKNTNLTAIGDAAIDCESGNVIIDSVNLKAASDGRESIYGKEITLSNCALVEISGADEAICASKKVSIINCPNVKLESDQLNTIGADDILIDNSNVTVTANHGYSGLVAIVYEDDDGNGNVTIKDSKITVMAEGSGIKCNSLSISGAKTEVYSVGDTDSDGKGCGAIIEGDESAISVSDGTVKLTGGEAGIRFEMKGDVNPFNGSLANAEFMGNTAFDTFTSLQTVNYKSEKNQGFGTFYEYSYIGDEMAKSLAVMHNHVIVKVDGVMATTANSGFKSYYKCDCGKYFEDENGKIEIADIEKWKAEGGNGYLPKTAEQKGYEELSKTGDTSNITFWMLLMITAFISLVFFEIISKRSMEE